MANTYAPMPDGLLGVLATPRLGDAVIDSLAEAWRHAVKTGEYVTLIHNGRKYVLDPRSIPDTILYAFASGAEFGARAGHA